MTREIINIEGARISSSMLTQIKTLQEANNEWVRDIENELRELQDFVLITREEMSTSDTVLLDHIVRINRLKDLIRVFAA